jgi:hypothetical protein
MHVNGKMTPVLTIPGMWEGMKGNGREDKYKYDILDIL